MPQKNRETGFTQVTSVSVSKYFKDLIRKYDLSPTEVFRIGMGAILCEMQVEEYQTDLNTTRIQNAREFLKNLDEKEGINQKLNELRASIEKVGELLK